MTPPAAATAAARGSRAHRTRNRPIAPRGPRRVSGPARVPARPLPAGPAAASPAAARLATATIEHRLVDRLVRGRLWIVLLGGLLLGLVAMQVSLLKLNAQISRSVDSVTTLERQNAALRASIAGLESTDRLQSAATAMGMVLPAPADILYRRVRRSDGREAATALDGWAAAAAAAAASAQQATTTTTTAESAQPAPPTGPTQEQPSQVTTPQAGQPSELEQPATGETTGAAPAAE